MEENQYFKKVKNGNIIVNILPKVIPLFLWVFFIQKYYYPFYKTFAKNSYIFLFLMILPFIPVITEIFINRKLLFDDNKIMKPTTWQSCLTLFGKKERDKGLHSDIKAKFSYRCGSNEIEYNQFMMSVFQTRFYYLNFTLFLLVLISQKFAGLISTKDKLGNYHVIFIAIALFYGTIGTLPSSYAYSYAWSLMAGMIFSSLLNMNIAAFLIALYSIRLKLS